MIFHVYADMYEPGRIYTCTSSTCIIVSAPDADQALTEAQRKLPEYASNLRAVYFPDQQNAKPTP